ncbi:MAG: hypothetical protein EXQ58_04965 [Acidobacteria bacterium]|nr:hypothetical protein [Acidobacteriota bacterium]
MFGDTRLIVTPLWKNGANQIRIVVGNLTLNYSSGHLLKLFNLRHGVRFELQDMNMVRALPVGLLVPTAPE